MLMKAIDSYLSVRRMAGYELQVPEYLLRSFARYASDRGEDHVLTQTVIDWASQAPSLGQRDHRLKTVKRFAQHVKAEDPRHEIPPMGIFGFRKKRRIPFIFSNDDANHLLLAATELGPQDSLRPHTYSTLFALLITTGLRISEALALQFDDLTPDGLIVRRTKFQKSRFVPLHKTAQFGMKKYLARRRRFATCDNHVFVSLRGRVLHRSAVQWTFLGILESTGLGLAPNGRRPRIHDLRHTYACRALESCPEGRENISRHIRALSTCMGHVKIADTYWYLESTPYLTQSIANACESFSKKGKS